MKRPIRAWAVLTPKDHEDAPDQLAPYGNGEQWQYPIFHSRAEAVSWKHEAEFDRGRLVRVTIQIEEGK